MRSSSTSSQWQSVISLQPMSQQRNWKMDRHSFSLVLDVCKALGRWQQAVKIVKASEGSGGRVVGDPGWELPVALPWRSKDLRGDWQQLFFFF